MREYFLGIDLGTTACKALLVNSECEEISEGSAEYLVIQPGPNQQELDFDDVWRGMIKAVRQALKGIDKKSVLAIGFSSMMHGFMPVDKNHQPLCRMLTWADGRAMAQAQLLKEILNEKDVYKRTGCPLTALYYPARILWLKENQPEIFSKTSKFVSIKDAILFRLTGRWVIDKSHASSNGLLDIHLLKWHKPLFPALKIEPEKFPELVEPEEPVGTLCAESAKTLGLPEGILVIPGAGDGGLANLGSGAVEMNQVAVTIGTSGAARKVLIKPWLNPDASTWLYYLGNKHWYAGGAINSGGIVLRWLRDSLLSHLRDRALLKKQEPYSEIIKLAMTAPPGADGLIFLPYIFGERTPYWNPDARGVFFGISPHHTQAHFARAVLEGITLAICNVLSLLEKSPGDIREIRASGGLSRSEAWLKLLADMTGMQVVATKTSQGSAMGAAIMAMLGSGRIKSLKESARMIKVEKKFEPDLKKTAFYQEQLLFFKNLYEHLEKHFSRLKKIQNWTGRGF